MGRVAGGDLYEVIGGTPGCRRLAEIFYARVERDPVLRPLFPGKSMRCAIEEFSAFLVQFLGGPAADTQRRWWLSLRESHLRFKIGLEHRSAWLRHMSRALEEAHIGSPARDALAAFFERSSAYVVNQVQASAGGEAAGMPPEIARCWNRQLLLDKAVAAVRSGDAEGALALAEAVVCDRALCAALLGLMIVRGGTGMLARVDERLREDPELISTRYSGRTLLHTAAGAGRLEIVQTILALGGDANAADAGGHPPLYSAGNECKAASGAAIVRALVQAGADVNACGGVQRCSALHMAARRGNAEVAAALLDCGAEINASDARGDTPLRRALNCRKPVVAALLRARGGR
jgi:hemoglobin